MAEIAHANVYPKVPKLPSKLVVGQDRDGNSEIVEISIATIELVRCLNLTWKTVEDSLKLCKNR